MALTKEDLRNIEKLLHPKFNAMRDNILLLNKKMDEGFERIYRYLSNRFEVVENENHMNSVDIDMIKHGNLRDKHSPKYKKLQTERSV